MHGLKGDFYAYTTMYASYRLATKDKEAVFEYIPRKSPWGGAMVFAGLERVLEYLEHLYFTEDDIKALAEMGLDDRGFTDYLRSFRFAGDVESVPEGTFIFAGEPALKVRAPISVARLVEGKILNALNYQTLVATKSRRVVQAADGRPVMEFGFRRAQEQDAANWGARAAYMAGFAGTSNVEAAAKFGIPVQGTLMHAWVQEYPDEYEAFKAYAAVFRNNPKVAKTFLVDTYDTLKSGVPNAIRVAREMLPGIRWGIRLDSGDLAYLSRKTREMLDAAGFPEAYITASNDLNEDLIEDLKSQGAKIDAFGVGTYNIVSYDCPALGGVYKMTQIDDRPVLKVSNNPEKITPPGVHTIYRFYQGGEARGDLIALADEPKPSGTGYFRDPSRPWLKKELKGCEVRQLVQTVMQKGKRVTDLPSLASIRDYVQAEARTFSLERLRLTNPHTYHVNFSQQLWELQQKLLVEAGRV
ncbi:MAG: nicotinate phosphoribosyltransferase [Bacillota bacterium]